MVGGNVRFSNRPFGVKRFQTIHHTSVDIAHGLALLFGIDAKALPAWDSRTRWNNLFRIRYAASMRPRFANIEHQIAGIPRIANDKSESSLFD